MCMGGGQCVYGREVMCVGVCEHRAVCVCLLTRAARGGGAAHAAARAARRRARAERGRVRRAHSRRTRRGGRATRTAPPASRTYRTCMRK